MLGRYEVLRDSVQRIYCRGLAYGYSIAMVGIQFGFANRDARNMHAA
jgi:hypothetical protein